MPWQNSARFEFSCTISHIPLALQTIGDPFFLIATYQGYTYIQTYFKGLFIHKHMNSLNFC
ncbi:hypothetical protein HanIR_Chr17g0875501 [Helianthus annuus]|nr:hypothetical protein HanIR_Chr17g0875501 [Helianthus annuus]